MHRGDSQGGEVLSAVSASSTTAPPPTSAPPPKKKSDAAHDGMCPCSETSADPHGILHDVSLPDSHSSLLCGTECDTCSFAQINWSSNSVHGGAEKTGCFAIDSILVRNAQCVTAYVPFRVDASFCPGDYSTQPARMKARRQTKCLGFVSNDEGIEVETGNSGRVVFGGDTDTFGSDPTNTALTYSFDRPGLLRIELDMDMGSAGTLACGVENFRAVDGHLLPVETVMSHGALR